MYPFTQQVFMHYGQLIMNKSQLLEYLSKKFNYLPAREIEKMFEKIISIFSDALANDNRIEIRGFGSFSTKVRKERIARNPKNGEKVSVKEKKSINFRFSKEVKKILNEE